MPLLRMPFTSKGILRSWQFDFMRWTKNFLHPLKKRDISTWRPACSRSLDSSCENVLQGRLLFRHQFLLQRDQSTILQLATLDLRCPLVPSSKRRPHRGCCTLPFWSRHPDIALICRHTSSAKSLSRLRKQTRE
jgi:hypothetical protein